MEGRPQEFSRKGLESTRPRTRSLGPQRLPLRIRSRRHREVRREGERSTVKLGSSTTHERHGPTAVGEVRTVYKFRQKEGTL